MTLVTQELETQMAHLGDVRQALMEERAERKKGDSAVDAQVKGMHDLLEQASQAQSKLGGEIPLIAKTFMGFQECTANKVSEIQRAIKHAEEANMVSQNKYDKQVNASSEVINRLSVVCNTQMKHMEKLNTLSARLDGINEVWDARSEKIFQQIAVVQDDVEAVHNETKKQVSVAMESVKNMEKHLRVELDQRTTRLYEVNEERIARHSSTVDDKLEVLKAAMDGKFETTNEMVERRSSYINEVMSKILTDGETARSQMDKEKQQMMDCINVEFRRMKSDALSNNVTHTSQLKQEGELAGDQVETFLQALESLDKRVNKESTVILEKAKLSAMDIADLRAMQNDKKTSQNMDVLIYWVQMCCDKLNLRPKGLLALPKRSSAVDGCRTACSADSPRRTVSRLAESPRRSLRVSENPSRPSTPDRLGTPMWGSKNHDDCPQSGAKKEGSGKDENVSTLRGSVMKAAGRGKIKLSARKSAIKSLRSSNPLFT